MSQAVALIPFADLEKMAETIAKSQLFGVKKKEEALSLMLIAQAEGLHPATIAQEYDIISGRPARKTHSVLARFQQAGGTVKWEKLTDTEVVGVFTHPQGGSVSIDWTLERAKKIKSWNNKLNNGNGGWETLADKLQWQNYPRSMLRARCIAEGVRAVYPLAIGGMLVVEEAQDLDVIEGTATRVPDNQVPGPVPKASDKPQETKTYPCGATSTGTAPMPDVCPMHGESCKAPATSQTQPAGTGGTEINAASKEAPSTGASSAATNTTATEGDIITEGRVKIMRARMAGAVPPVTDAQIEQHFGKPLNKMFMQDSKAIQDFIANPTAAK